MKKISNKSIVIVIAICVVIALFGGVAYFVSSFVGAMQERQDSRIAGEEILSSTNPLIGEFPGPEELESAVPIEAYYDTPEEAISNNTFNDKGEIQISDEIVRIEDENYLTIAYYCFTEKQGAVTYYAYKKVDGKVSNPISFQNFPLDWEEGSTLTNIYHAPKEAVAEYVMWLGINQNIFVKSNNGQYVYLGYSDDPSIEKLTILGQKPDAVVDFQDIDGKTWYLWYYTDLPAMETLDNDPDFYFSGYTLNQVIDILDIKIDE